MLCRILAADVADSLPGSDRGKPASWAAGVVYTIGHVNFLSDPADPPHVTSDNLARGLGVSPATMQAKASLIRKAFHIGGMEPELTLPSRLVDNPLVWMVETQNGFLIDLRHESREVQQEALDAGLIPFLPPRDKADNA